MLVLLSPSKALDYDRPAPTQRHTRPELLDHTADLLKITRDLSVDDLRDLMHLSEDLATLNRDRFQSFELPFTPDNAKPAALVFDGDVYKGFDANSLSEADLLWAQDHVRILSGLYGVLRPLDLMQPYRLEMGTRLENARGKDLYAFWRDTLTPWIADDARRHPEPVIVNLASNEYSKAVRLKKLGVPVVTPRFEDEKDGKARVISFFAKKARGWMARWIVEHRATRAEQLEGFDTGGYTFVPEASTAEVPVFRRPQPPAAR